jgi:DnaJ-class molecular chaperone
MKEGAGAGPGSGGMGDIFDMFMGGHGGGGGRSRQREKKSEDVQHKLTVSLEELFLGATKYVGALLGILGDF